MEVKLVVLKGSKKTREIRLTAAETVIGRQTGCGLRIPSDQVSRSHCRLRIQGDCVTVEDLKSANGTHLNGTRIAGLVVVRPGDRLEVGPVAFQVEYRLTERTEQRLPPPAPTPAPASVPTPPPALPPLPEAIPLADDDFVQAIPLDDSPDGRTVVAPGAAPQPVMDNDAAQAFDSDESWRMPEGQDLRNLLSLDDEA